MKIQNMILSDIGRDQVKFSTRNQCPAQIASDLAGKELERVRRVKRGACKMPKANVVCFKVSPRDDPTFSREKKSSFYSPLCHILSSSFYTTWPQEGQNLCTILQDALRMNLTLLIMHFYGNVLSVFQHANDFEGMLLT